MVRGGDRIPISGDSKITRIQKVHMLRRVGERVVLESVVREGKRKRRSRNEKEVDKKERKWIGVRRRKPLDGTMRLRGNPTVEKFTLNQASQDLRGLENTKLREKG